MRYKQGDKVVAITKTPGQRSVDSCASYYRRIELNQEFLYVNGVDEESTEYYGEPCYWCDAVEGKGDRYKESDLIPY